MAAIARRAAAFTMGSVLLVASCGASDADEAAADSQSQEASQTTTISTAATKPTTTVKATTTVRPTTSQSTTSTTAAPSTTAQSPKYNKFKEYTDGKLPESLTSDRAFVIETAEVICASVSKSASDQELADAVRDSWDNADSATRAKFESGFADFSTFTLSQLVTFCPDRLGL